MRFATLFCAVGLLATPALGKVKQSDYDICSSLNEGIIAAIPANAPTLPNTLASDRDVFVIINAGAAYTEVTVLGRKGTPGRALAEALDASFPGAHGDVSFTDDEQYAATAADAPNGRYFSHARRSVSPIGAIVTGIRAKGYIPHALLRVPRYASIATAFPESPGTKTFHWYNISNVPAGAVVSVEARLANTVWIIATIAILFPFLAVLLNLTGIVIALNHRASLDTRKLWFKRLGWRSDMGVLLFSAFLTLVCSTFRSARMVGDIWNGWRNGVGLISSQMLSIPVLLGLSLVMMLLHKRLLGEPEEPVAVVEFAPDEKAVRKRINWYVFAVWLIGTAVYLGSWHMPRRAPAHIFIRFGAFVLMVFSRDIVQRLFRKQLAPFEKKERDADLTSRASSIAPEGKRVTEVRIDDGQYGRSGAYATAQRDGSVLVSRVLADGFTPEEFDFAVAQAAAQGPYQYRLLLRTVPFALVGSAWPAFWLFGPLRHHVNLEPQARMLVMMGPWFAILLGGGYLLTLSIKRGFARADRAALAITRNLPAAQSALQKMHTAGGQPYTEAKADPKLAWRLTALQRAAHDLGITGNCTGNA